jgi:hypothetical protein
MKGWGSNTTIELTKSQITTDALAELTFRGCKVWRNNNVAIRGRKFIGERGVPDIVGFHRTTGVAVYCEVKTINDRFSMDQIIFMNRAKLANCFCVIASDEKGKMKLSEWEIKTDESQT